MQSITSDHCTLRQRALDRLIPVDEHQISFDAIYRESHSEFGCLQNVENFDSPRPDCYNRPGARGTCYIIVQSLSLLRRERFGVLYSRVFEAFVEHCGSGYNWTRQRASTSFIHSTDQHRSFLTRPWQGMASVEHLLYHFAYWLGMSISRRTSPLHYPVTPLHQLAPTHQWGYVCRESTGFAQVQRLDYGGSWPQRPCRLTREGSRWS